MSFALLMQPVLSNNSLPEKLLQVEAIDMQ
jgi:hypothetical protein